MDMTEGRGLGCVGLCYPDPDGIAQRPTGSLKEIPFNDGRTLVLEYS